MKKVIITLLFSGGFFCTMAQNTFQPNGGGGITISKNGGSALELAPKPPTTEGSYYYNDQNKVGNIYFKDGRQMENLMFRYDLSKKWLEITQGEEVKIAPENLVQRFEFTSPMAKQTFINAADYVLDNTKMEGFLEVITDGQVKMLAGTNLAFKPTNYNALMDVGEKNNQIIKTEVIYLGKGNELLEVSPKTKDIFGFFGDKKGQVAAYADKYKLKARRKEDLRKVVEFYNTLI